MVNTIWSAAIYRRFLGVLVVLWLGADPKAAPADEAATFPLKEVSVFEKKQDKGSIAQMPLRGEHGSCSTVPDKEVKTYPKLKSKRPLYGTVTFGRSFLESKATVEYHYVLDESEGTPDAPAPPWWKSLLGRLIDLGEESGPPAKYDRLYFDANRDLDLTNDPVVTPMNSPPPGIKELAGDEPRTRLFNYLDVPFDYGPQLGRQPLRVLPRLQFYGPSNDHAYALFTPAVARQGTIRVGKKEYSALLCQAYAITGCYDRPCTSLFLTPVGAALNPTPGWCSDWLCSMREIDGQLYRFSTTPKGDQLTVTPYRGEFGLLEVGPGGRNVKDVGMSGVVFSDTSALLSLGKADFGPNPEKSRQFRLPVGDYRPLFLTLQMGRVTVNLFQNQDRGCGGSGAKELSFPYPIKIRKDKPFVLEFSGKPVFVFNSPAQGVKFASPPQIEVEAMLTDPTLGVMIRGMVDRSRKIQDRKLHDENGMAVIDYPEYASLEPVVTIKDSSGKEVASGKMPFG